MVQGLLPHVLFRKTERLTIKSISGTVFSLLRTRSFQSYSVLLQKVYGKKQLKRQRRRYLNVSGGRRLKMSRKREWREFGVMPGRAEFRMRYGIPMTKRQKC